MMIGKPRKVSTWMAATVARALRRGGRIAPFHVLLRSGHKRTGQTSVTVPVQVPIQEPVQDLRPVPATPRLPYRAEMAVTEADRMAAYRLRFRVFNLELNEGLEAAYSTGADTDEFDRFCDHVLVRSERTGDVVGTYRLQSGRAAAANLGYYSSREFDLSPYEPLRGSMIELGRACIHPDHRKYEVLMLLWKAIVRYAADRGASYLIGCSSLNSQDERFGSAVYHKLKSLEVPEPYRTVPTAGFSFPVDESAAGDEAKPPKLLRTYLALGANICGPPALDRQFKTIDFLTLMDLNSLSPAIRNRLFR
jgi:putative hemolysin